MIRKWVMGLNLMQRFCLTYLLGAWYIWLEFVGYGQWDRFLKYFPLGEELVYFCLIGLFFLKTKK